MAPRDSDTENFVSTLLADRLSSFQNSNCAKVFEEAGVNVDRYLKTASDTRYYDVRPSGKYSSLTQDQVVGNKLKVRLSESVPYGDDAATIKGPLGSAVLLAANFRGTKAILDQLEPAELQAFKRGQVNTLQHEALHAYGLSDEQIFKNEEFQKHGLAKVNPGTSDISDWLGRDCT